jgi:predicted nicotinamide N-methyase
MFSMQRFRDEYETDSKDLAVRGESFTFFVPASLDRFIDSDDVFHNFPLWAKLWEASLVLADHLAGLEVKAEKTFLEIGSGLGMVGIIASRFGHRVTSTEYDPHALNFARANARLNRCPDLEIAPLDWSKPSLEGVFDHVIGSEVIYREKDFQSLIQLFKTYLKPDGEIILAEGVRRTTMDFLRKSQEFFKITAQKKTLRSENQAFPVVLCRMRAKG